MKRQQMTAVIQSALEDQLIQLQQPSHRRLYLTVTAGAIRSTARLMSREFGARLQTVSAVDAPTQIELLYHWALDSWGLVVTVRTRIDRRQPEIESISDLCPAASWIEREVWELLGVCFRGHPELVHLLLADDWPPGQFPLRRDYRRR